MSTDAMVVSSVFLVGSASSRLTSDIARHLYASGLSFVVLQEEVSAA
jgi:hypothetical protein